jgi:hypothetical protein
MKEYKDKKIYIYFFDTQSIVLCEDENDALQQIGKAEKVNPKRKWIIVESIGNGEFRMIADNKSFYDGRKELSKTLVVIYIFIIIAILLVIYSCFVGLI